MPTPAAGRGALLLSARGALAGAIGGMAAGALDYVLALGKIGAFLPRGGLSLLVFLIALYGAAASAMGAFAGALAGGLAWSTDLGPLWRAGFDSEEPRDGARWAAYALAIALAGAGLGWAAQAIVADALARYHSWILIAALSGGTIAALAVPAAAAVFLVAAALTPIVRIGPRARTRLHVSPAIAATAWTLGLALAAAGIAYRVYQLQSYRRVPLPAKALNAGVLAPIILFAALLAAHFAARFV